VREAEHADISGWDFRWFDGRASEDRPSWHYFDLVAERARSVSSLLDLEVGNGHMVVALPRLPPLTVGTEGYQPNIAAAAESLRSRGGARRCRARGAHRHDASS